MTQFPETEFDDETFVCFLTEVVLKMNYGCKVIEANDHDLEKDCPICFETLKNSTLMVLPCGIHEFHYSCMMMCILKYQQYSCPECCVASVEVPKQFEFKKETNLSYPMSKNSQIIPEIHENYVNNNALVLYNDNNNVVKPSAPTFTEDSAPLLVESNCQKPIYEDDLYFRPEVQTYPKLVKIPSLKIDYDSNDTFNSYNQRIDYDPDYSRLFY